MIDLKGSFLEAVAYYNIKIIIICLSSNIIPHRASERCKVKYEFGEFITHMCQRNSGQPEKC